VMLLGYIAIELIQKYIKDNSAIRVEDLDRWPSNSNVVRFLFITTSVPLLDDLLKVSINCCVLANF
jgi:hypothetical protein